MFYCDHFEFSYLDNNLGITVVIRTVTMVFGFDVMQDEAMMEKNLMKAYREHNLYVLEVRNSGLIILPDFPLKVYLQRIQEGDCFLIQKSKLRSLNHHIFNSKSDKA